MNINIMGLMPEIIGIKVGDRMFNAVLDEDKYVLNELLNDYLETDTVSIYVDDKLFDTIDKRIALRQGDTLHLEYSIHVGE